MIEDHKKFLNTIKNLELYLVKFEKDRLIKTKKYIDDCIVERDKCYLIIVITYNKYTFFANDGIWKAWI